MRTHDRFERLPGNSQMRRRSNSRLADVATDRTFQQCLNHQSSSFQRSLQSAFKPPCLYLDRLPLLPLLLPSPLQRSRGIATVPPPPLPPPPPMPPLNRPTASIA